MSAHDMPVETWAAANNFGGDARALLLDAADTLGDLIDADPEDLEMCLEPASWKRLTWSRFSRLIDEARREGAAAAVPPEAESAAPPSTPPPTVAPPPPVASAPSVAAPPPATTGVAREPNAADRAFDDSSAGSSEDDDDMPKMTADRAFDVAADGAKEEEDDSEEEEDAPPRKRPRTTAAAQPRASYSSKYYGKLQCERKSCLRDIDVTPSQAFITIRVRDSFEVGLKMLAAQRYTLDASPLKRKPRTSITRPWPSTASSRFEK